MKFVILCSCLVLCMTCVFSATITSPAMQRKNLGESCTFRWNVTGNFTTYTIKLLSTGGLTALGRNTNHTYNGIKGIITLFIWNIQRSDAGNYSLSISTGPHSTESNSAALLFVYSAPYAYTFLAVGRNPGFEGDKLELNCSVTSGSLPVAYQNTLYYFWYSGWFGNLRIISNGPAVLQNGDVLNGYSIKNEGKTLVIASAQYTDKEFYCSVQEEGSPYNSANLVSSLQIYSRPYTYSLNPVSRKCNAVPYSTVYLYFYYQSNPPLTSYTNWSFVNASGSTKEYPVGNDPLTYLRFHLSIRLDSVNSYGNYSVTLTNSNGSRTETFQVLPLGPPDTPSNFEVQYVTHSLISFKWRCMWFNGVQQTIFIRLTDVANNEEVQTQTVSLATDCYNTAYGTLFQSNIQPETDYEASIWSINKGGSSDVVKLAVRTPKRLIFDTSSANISIMGTQATINFRIADSTKAIIRLNVTCCVEITTQCNNKSYIIANTDNQIVYDILPTGNEYVFEFTVYDTDGYTYVYTTAIVKGVRVSRTEVCSDPMKCSHIVEKSNPLVVPVIVLAVILGVAVLLLIGCLIGFLVSKYRQPSNQKTGTSEAKRNKPEAREPSEYANTEETYESVADVDPSRESACYTALEDGTGRAKSDIKTLQGLFAETS